MSDKTIYLVTVESQLMVHGKEAIDAIREGRDLSRWVTIYRVEAKNFNEAVEIVESNINKDVDGIQCFNSTMKIEKERDLVDLTIK